MQKPSVGTIHLVLGLILVSIDVFFIFIFAIMELGNIGQTATYDTTFGDAMFAIVMNVLIFLVLPALGGFEIGRWVQARKRALQFSAEATPTLERVAVEAPAKSEMGVYISGDNKRRTAVFEIVCGLILILVFYATLTIEVIPIIWIGALFMGIVSLLTGFYHLVKGASAAIDRSIGGMGWSIASIILGLVGFFVIAGGFLGIFGAVLGYYGVRKGSKFGYVGLVFGVIVFLLTVISGFS